MLCVWLPVCPPCSTPCWVKMGITLPAWSSLLEPFLMASAGVLEHDAICLVIRGSAALGFMDINVQLRPDLCSWHVRLPQFGGKTTLLLESGSAWCFVECIMITSVTEQSDLFDVLCTGTHVQTHVPAMAERLPISLKGTSISDSWGGGDIN